MKKKILFSVLAAAVLSVPCRAQELAPTVPACGLWRIDPAHVERLGEFEAAAVTLLPADTVIWLDGKPLELFTPVSPAQLQRIWVFSAVGYPELGITSFYSGERPVDAFPKIRCINPKF